MESISRGMRDSRLRPPLAIAAISLVAFLACARKDVPPFVQASSCVLAPTSLDFGSVNVGGSADKTFKVTNTGTDVSSGTVSETCSDYSLVGSGDYSLAAGESKTFTLHFSPSAAGSRPCTVSIGDCGTLAVTGQGLSGTPPPGSQCSVSPTSLSFGIVAVGQSATRTFTIKNVGGGTLDRTLSESCPDFSIDGSASVSLGPGESATITVRFTPATAGDESCNIDTGAGCGNVKASGTGQAATASCQLSTSSVDFGDVAVGQTADQPLTVTNTGGGLLSGTLAESCSEFSIVGSASYLLAGGASATYTLRFAPTAEGDSMCTLNVGAACGAVSLHGHGVTTAPECQLSATSHDFGDVQLTRHTVRDGEPELRHVLPALHTDLLRCSGNGVPAQGALRADQPRPLPVHDRSGRRLPVDHRDRQRRRDHHERELTVHVRRFPSPPRRRRDGRVTAVATLNSVDPGGTGSTSP
ncbi:MAG: choice-of-anchor D domain-containing protein [Candidatus Eisenbacteria bacterium]|uniref:Choice-of-anchor D domain-containing protein n=1 Tax=Eiseniibacteriota bacterium TaxID=2212470 RepID=A0A538U7H8_UNCEI|nr:MAG: choice-of-anchor D domain-containing protein [Candidatus Eisenbacteria bacterium]